MQFIRHRSEEFYRLNTEIIYVSVYNKTEDRI